MEKTDQAIRVRLEFGIGNDVLYIGQWELNPDNTMPIKVFGQLARTLDAAAQSRMDGIMSNETLPYKFALRKRARRQKKV